MDLNRVEGPWGRQDDGRTGRPRICLVHLNLEGGGAERQLLHLVRHWDPEQWDIDVVLLEDAGVWLDRLPRHVRLFTLGGRRPRLGPLQWLWALRMVPRLRRRLRAGGYDIVVTFIWLPTLLTALALGKRKDAGKSAIADRPLLVWSAQSDLESDFRVAWDGRLRIAALRRVLPDAVDHAVAVSGRIKARAARSVWLSPARFTVIPNAIDLRRIREQAHEADEVSPRTRALRIVSVGRLHPAKGMDHLLEALARLPDELPEWECCLIGTGPDRAGLEARARELGLAARADRGSPMADRRSSRQIRSPATGSADGEAAFSAAGASPDGSDAATDDGDRPSAIRDRPALRAGPVHFIGFTDNPFAWIRSADLFVLAARWEPGGIAVAEAMALGRAVICTITDGPSEIIADGRDGVLVPPGDVQRLSEAIGDLLVDDVRRARLGVKAMETARRYDAPLVATAYAETMRVLLSRR